MQRAAHWASLTASSGLPRGAVGEGLDAIVSDTDPRVRAAALGALVRHAGRSNALRAWSLASRDPSRDVRRRAGELAPSLTPPPVRALARLLRDPDPLVAETAAWALGECADRARPHVTTLSRLATGHDDALVREAAAAALGAIGDRRGLPAILAATTDKPAIRRRAVLALAPFDGPEVDEALRRAAQDRDWQVRDAAATLDP